MITIVGVRFKKAGKIYYFSPKDIQLKVEDGVIVETARGIEYGEVVIGARKVTDDSVVQPLKSVLRKATPDDYKQVAKNKEKEKKAYNIAIKKIAEHKLPMKLIDVEYTFDLSKVIFFFTAEGRVDFRALVKDMAPIFKTRIELRQVGVRDEAKILNSMGMCGRALCCSTFLGEFSPVSIKMAKNQKLSLNPAKISGVCGRLLCCLKYEDDLYKKGGDLYTAPKDNKTYQKLPKPPGVGKKVLTDEGLGKVLKINSRHHKIKVQLEDGRTIDVGWGEIDIPDED